MKCSKILKIAHKFEHILKQSAEVPTIFPKYNIGDKVRYKDREGQPSGPILVIVDTTWIPASQSQMEEEEIWYSYVNHDEEHPNIKQAPGEPYSDKFILVERGEEDKPKAPAKGDIVSVSKKNWRS